MKSSARKTGRQKKVLRKEADKIKFNIILSRLAAENRFFLFKGH